MLHAAAQEGLHALTRELIAAAKLRGEGREASQVRKELRKEL